MYEPLKSLYENDDEFLIESTDFLIAYIKKLKRLERKNRRKRYINNLISNISNILQKN
jgi:hypothetical protein